MAVRKLKTKVFGNKRNGQLSITLPKKRFKKIQPGDIISLTIEDAPRGGKLHGKNKKQKGRMQ